MRKFIAGALSLTTMLSVFTFAPITSKADSVIGDFETYSIGNIDGQDGWMKTGPYDVAVVANNYGFGTFGTKTLRISDSVTSGSFGDQTFSKPLADEAGEADALNGGMSGGTRQPHFEAQFDLASTMPTYQPGMHMSVSPDRGDGARMSYLRFEDAAGGINAFFYDVQGVTNPANFVETQVATNLSRAMPHSIKFVMDFVNGPSNDVVKVYIDGILVHTGTSWENYYRFDSESNPSLVSNSRTVDSLLFRLSGTATSANAGNGFLVDNSSIVSGPVPNAICSTTTLVSGTDTQFKHLATVNPVGSSADGSFTLGTPGAAVAAGPDGFPGAWDTAANDPDVAGAIFVNNMATAPSNPAGVEDGQNGLIDTWRLFSHSFTIPAGATLISANLHVSADNSVEAFLDNASVGTSPDFTTVSDLPLTITPGAHELEFVVKNDSYDGATNPTAVIYKATVDYCVPNTPPALECPAAPSIAAAYLKTLGIKSGSKEYKSIISLVAMHMGPQTFFDGVGACNLAYAGVVQAFVNANKTVPKK